MFSNFWLSSGNLVADYLEIAAQSAYDMFSWYKYLSINSVFPIPRFLEWKFLSDCAISCFAHQTLVKLSNNSITASQ